MEKEKEMDSHMRVTTVERKDTEQPTVGTTKQSTASESQDQNQNSTWAEKKGRRKMTRTKRQKS